MGSLFLKSDVHGEAWTSMYPVRLAAQNSRSSSSVNAACVTVCLWMCGLGEMLSAHLGPVCLIGHVLQDGRWYVIGQSMTKHPKIPCSNCFGGPALFLQTPPAFFRPLPLPTGIPLKNSLCCRNRWHVFANQIQSKVLIDPETVCKQEQRP